MPVVRNPQYYFREGFCWTFTLNEAESKLSEIQEKLDTIVNELYGI